MKKKATKRKTKKRPAPYISEKLHYAMEFIDLEKASGFPGARWERFQMLMLNDGGTFSHDVKSRQIAWSFTAALDAVVDGILNPGSPHIFVSINQDEAAEKIRYVNDIVSAIRPGAPGAPTLDQFIQRSKTIVEWPTGSRFISHPCRPPRGKPNLRIYLDEMAHYPHGLDREVYTASLPATIRGDGYLRMGSSPLGAKGLFWEIGTEAMRRYPGYRRGVWPWWSVYSMVRGGVLPSWEEVSHLTTEDRVYEFGSDALINLFENMFLEDFQQEFEAEYQDSATAYIVWETIKKNQQEDLLYWHAKSPIEARVMLQHILQAHRDGKIEQVFSAGIDVGRSRDLTEFFMVGKGTSNNYPLRFMVSLFDIPFDEQEELLREIINALPINRTFIDRNGIGMQLAENLSRLSGVEGVNFTNETKEMWAIDLRKRMEKGETPIPLDRELGYQIHSIKKTSTSTNKNRYDTERNEKHHADKFWALALAVYGAANYGLRYDTVGDDDLGHVPEAMDRWK